MSEVTLTICGAGSRWQAAANPQGTLIGRDPACDVVIDTMEVSRRHARLFCAPSGQWILEDLGSTNGLYVNGQRVESSGIGPGDVAKIGPAYLSLGPMPEHLLGAPLPQGPKIVVEDFGTEILYDKPRLEDCAARPCPDRLDRLCQRLSGLTAPARIYLEVCRSLARGPRTAAAVFQTSLQSELTTKTLEVLAYHFGGSGPADTQAGRAGGFAPSPRALRVSHRLLDAVRSGRRPLMTKSIFSCDTQVTLSLMDELSPQALICAPLGVEANTVRLLYVDVPIDDRTGPPPEEMFAFVQAAVREVSAAGSLRREGC
ncbi:MAG: FHA domain-containing protein [Planctomycetes bacterium]|jgi:hypothetical protein|nr:FHA domain-containing protein [Planctomycetota bacterium]